MSELFFSKNIKFLRKSKNLSIVELAKQSPKGKSMLSDYENGNSEPNLEMLKWFSDFFGKKIDDLILKDLSIEDNDNIDVKIERVEPYKLGNLDSDINKYAGKTEAMLKLLEAKIKEKEELIELQRFKITALEQNQTKVSEARLAINA